MDKKFTIPCFIRVTDKNKQYVTDKLKSMGYNEFVYGTLIDRHCIVANHCISGQFSCIEVSRLPKSEADLCNDCGTNTSLFLALAAMNDTDDYMQWFVRCGTGIGDSYYLCKAKRFRNIRVFRHKSKMGGEYHNGIYRKATKDELIKYFQKV